MSRWLKAWTAMPRRIKSATMSACRSENASTRSGRNASIFRDVGRGEGADARLVAPRLGRPHRVAGNADDAVLPAQEIERLDGFLGQADDPARREHDRPILLINNPDSRGCQAGDAPRTPRLRIASHRPAELFLAFTTDPIQRQMVRIAPPFSADDLGARKNENELGR